MDLNEPPPEFDDDLLADFAVDFCTQVPSLSENHQPRGVNVDQQNLPEEVVPTISEIRLSLEQARIEDRDEGPAAVNGTDGEEVISTPQIPFIGQTFATKEEARAYYNSYAKRICCRSKKPTSFQCHTRTAPHPPFPTGNLSQSAGALPLRCEAISWMSQTSWLKRTCTNYPGPGV